MDVENMWNNDRLFTSRRVSAHPDCYLACGRWAHMFLRHMCCFVCEVSNRNKLNTLNEMFPYTVTANSWLYVVYSVWVFHIWELLRVQKQNIHVCQKNDRNILLQNLVRSLNMSQENIIKYYNYNYQKSAW